jgi:hypothetical protein
MTAAVGTTHPKGGTFGGTTALMGLITTLTDETTGSSGCVGVLEPSVAQDGRYGVMEVLEDCCGGLVEVLVLVSLKN